MRLLAVAALAAGVVALLWLQIGSRDTARTVIAPAGVDGARAEPMGVELDDSLTSADHAQQRSAVIAADSGAISSKLGTASKLDAASSSMGSAVFGRVLDELGAPVADALVSLRPMAPPWAPGVLVPVATTGPSHRYQFETTTDGDGRFRFEVPTPTSDWIRLRVAPHDLLGFAERHFGPADGRNQPRLVAGDNALGDIVLTLAGAIEGRVLTANGNAPAAGRVRIMVPRVDDRLLETKLADDGTFTLGHLPAGVYAIEAEAEGLLSVERAGIDVTKNATTRIADLELHPSPSIAGIVVDDSGAPVAHALVRAWPRRLGSPPEATSSKSGSFTIVLRRDEPHFLEVKDLDGFEDWGNRQSAQFMFEPGRSDVRIVLARTSKVRFVVIDRETSEPITRYGIAINPRPRDGIRDSSRYDRISVGTHSRGEIRARANPELDLVAVVAPGYAPFEGPVSRDSASEGTQTIALERGGTLVGSVMLAGVPLADASIVIERDRIKLDPTKPSERDERFDKNMGFDVDEFGGRKQTLEAQKDGTFTTKGLAPGTYQLTASGGDAARKVVRGVRIEKSATNDLGTIELDLGATIRGHVTVGRSLSPVGLRVWILDGSHREVKIDSEEGRFAFSRLEAGLLTLVVSAQHPVLLQNHQERVVLERGETKSVEIDLARFAPSTFVVRTMRNGEPLPGIRVDWGAWRDGTIHSVMRGIVSDESGFARGMCPPGDQCVFVAHGEGGIALARTSVPIAIPASGLHESVLEIVAGSLIVELPSSIALPEQGNISLQLRRKTPDSDYYSAWAITRSMPGFLADALEWSGRELEVPLVPAGEFELVARVARLSLTSEQSGQWVRTSLSDESPIDVTIRANETTRVSLKAK